MKDQIKIFLAAPRGFCAGVDRAIQIVEQALERFGAPVYVRHEIVHNRHVVDELRDKGAVFVEELDEIPANHTDRPVIFSAHGVPKTVPEKAEALNMFYIDATCPLVSKVHREAERHHKDGAHIILIGHRYHPEVSGTMGQLPLGAVTLVETEDDAVNLPQGLGDEKLAYVTQTTLSVDDTAQIIAALQTRYPAITGPAREDICYATTNRQEAVKHIAEQVDLMLVIGAPNSSNSNRLVEVAKNYGTKAAYLIETAQDINWEWFDGCKQIGLTAGASAPEVLVKEVINACETRYETEVEEVTLRREDVIFKLPRVLTA